MPELKILVVDDNEEFGQNVKDILEMESHTVELVYNGLEAIELVQRNGFDLVLMDVRMPVMNGVEAFKKIKEMMPRLPVIMVTAFAVEDLIKEALREGAFGSLKKPLDFDKLFALIERAIPNGALILVVDDDRDLCANMKDVLSDKGYRVSVAHNGNKAIEKARENDFDIMLLDLKLPPLNGLETYLAIRDIRPNLVAIIITGFSQEMGHLVHQARQRNAYACLEKPVNIDELVSLLQRIEEQKT